MSLQASRMAFPAHRARSWSRHSEDRPELRLFLSKIARSRPHKTIPENFYVYVINSMPRSCSISPSGSSEFVSVTLRGGRPHPGSRAGGYGVMKWRFARSLDVRTRGLHCRRRQRLRADPRWMQALNGRTEDRRMAPTEVNLAGAAPSALHAIRLAGVRPARRSAPCLPESPTLTFRYLGVQTRHRTIQ